MLHSVKIFVFFSLFFATNILFAQGGRINEYNTIGWYNYFGTFALSKTWSIHTEYQWRRTDWITAWQQSLLRVGVNYQLHPKVQLRVGYGWIETFPYSQTPINAFGKDFTEHRIFQAVTLTDKLPYVDVLHRFMLEQRWLGTYSNTNLEKEDRYIFLNRLRYMFRLQIPLQKEPQQSFPYTAIYDEIFIGFGKNLGENIFDQNRLGILLGYQFSKKFKVEGGFFNQILLLGREVNGVNILQNNTGIILNAVFNISLEKPVKE
ncbi:MAG: DUF2490 domain-containing protein [Raineya sp.]|nr:DUF2490 domain-containing protein [Raineya sp.]